MCGMFYHFKIMPGISDICILDNHCLHHLCNSRVSGPLVQGSHVAPDGCTQLSRIAQYSMSGVIVIIACGHAAAHL